MSRHLLPCSCGKAVSVSTAQAGGTAVCECGKSLPIPSIRGLRDLPLDGSEREIRPEQAAPAAMNTMGTIFAVSIMLLVGGFASCAYNGFVLSQIDTRDHEEEVAEWAGGEIDKLPVDKLYAAWRSITARGLGEHEPPHHVRAREVYRHYLAWTIGSGIVGVLGLAGMATSLKLGEKK